MAISYTEVVRLTAPDADFFDSFGSAVALYEDTMIVGVPAKGQNIGAAYVFRRVDGLWQFEAKLEAFESSRLGVALGFGHAVALHENIAIVAAGDVGKSKSGVFMITPVSARR